MYTLPLMEGTTIRDIMEGEAAEGFACHEETRKLVAWQWETHGFTADNVAKWLNARCFNPDAAAAMRDAGIAPEDAEEHTDRGDGGYTDTIGYKVSNCDLSVDEAARIADGTIVAFHDDLYYEGDYANGSDEEGD